jgi:membrane fusion protein (multidrug efflux system)
MKKFKKEDILKIVGAVVAVVIIYFLYEHIRYVETDNAQIDAHAVMLAAKVGGYIAKVNINEGQQVKKGDVLVEIDDRDYQAQLQQAQANLVSVEARMTEAEKNYHRLTDLYRQGGVSQQQFDSSTSVFSETKAQHDSSQAQVQMATLNLSFTKIIAPSDGYIAKRSVEVGQLAAPGVPLIGFVSNEERWVTANFKETEIEDVKAGAKVHVSVDAIGSRDFDGVVESISSATGATFTLIPPDNATGNFTKVVQRVPVRIRLENIGAREIELLRAGLSAVVKVHK